MTLVNVALEVDLFPSVIKAFQCSLTDKSVDALAKLFARPGLTPKTALRELHLSHNSLTDDGVRRLLDAIADCSGYPWTNDEGGRPQPLWLRLENNAVKDPEA